MDRTQRNISRKGREAESEPGKKGLCNTLAHFSPLLLPTSPYAIGPSCLDHFSSFLMAPHVH